MSDDDEILLEVQGAIGGPSFLSTTVTKDTFFGPTSAWGFMIPVGIPEMQPIFASYAGAFRITALTGSVNITEVTTTLRDGVLNDRTITNLSPVSEPGSAWLLVLGIPVLAGIRRMKRYHQQVHA